MRKLVRFLFTLLLTLIFLQSCTYFFNNSISFKIAVVDSQGYPANVTVNTDILSTTLHPVEDKFIHVNVNYKLPLIGVKGKNIYATITDFSTITCLLDSRETHLKSRFYLSNGTISLTGTLPATNNLYYMDYIGKGYLNNGYLDVDITRGTYTLFFPQYSKTFLIVDGKISDFTSPYSWSIKLYMDDGDSPSGGPFYFQNLRQFLLDDLVEIKNNYYTPEKSSILAYADLLGSQHCTYKFLRGEMFEIRSNLTDDSYDWRNLKNFINIPVNSRYKALFLWDHGDSWVYHENSKALLVDGQNAMNLTALASALSSNYFNIIAFDMCLMSSVEVLYEIRNFTDYLVFSEGPVPSQGFDYQNLLCGNYTPEDFALYISKRYSLSYNNKYSLTVVNDKYADDFFSYLDLLSKSLTSLASSDYNFVNYLKNGINTLDKIDLYYGYQVDLLSLLNYISEYEALPLNIKTEILEVKSSLHYLFVGSMNRIGIAFIHSDGSFNFDNYSHNSFSINLHWTSFLKILSERIQNDNS